MSQELLNTLKELDIVYKKPLELKHGGKSSYYIDVKKAYGYPEILNAMADELFGLMRNTNRKINCVASAEYGGLPLGTTISTRYDLKHILVRKEPKKYGRGGYFDGHFPEEGDVVAIVDDVITTGKTLNQLADRIRFTSADFVGCYAVFIRGKVNIGIPVYYLFEAENLIFK